MNQSPPESPLQSPAAPVAPQPIKRKFRWLRCLVILLCITILLFGILIYLVPTMLSADWVRREIVDGLQRDLRGSVTIEDIEVTWSRGVEVRGLRIGNPPGFSQDSNAIEVERVHADVDLSALLGEVFRFKLRVEEPRLFVQRRQDGAINLLGLTEETGKGKAGARTHGRTGSRESRWPGDFKRDYPNVLGKLEVDL
ncbi:MAG: hypothetical protein ACE5F1_02695, partial [Planctomycetota bacterium]